MRCCVLAGLVLLSGCVDFGDQDARVPGNDLGVFSVVARLTSSSCGPGALGAQDVWEFDVRLSRDDPHLMWLSDSDVTTGEIAPDGVSFSFETAVTQQLEEPQGNHPGCAVTRSDQASGKLVGQGTDVTSFTGRLGYVFAAKEQSDCSSLIGSAEGFALLPCEIGYEMEAQRRTPPNSTD
jgi:hypothetical protein